MSEARQGRKREANLKDAMDGLTKALDAAQRGELGAVVSTERKGQVGSGMRGDKTVTIRFQDDKVAHHMTGKTMSATRYMKGFMDEVWS
jgi:protein subunit release factor A